MPDWPSLHDGARPERCDLPELGSTTGLALVLPLFAILSCCLLQTPLTWPCCLLRSQAGPHAAAWLYSAARSHVLAHTSAPGVDQGDRRQLDMINYGATRMGEALCFDVTVVSPLTCGRPQLGAAQRDGAMLTVAERRERAAVRACVRGWRVLELTCAAACAAPRANAEPARPGIPALADEVLLTCEGGLVTAQLVSDNFLGTPPTVPTLLAITGAA